MRKILIVPLLFISAYYFSQPLNLNFAKSFGGLQNEEVLAMVTDKCGNIYVGGLFMDVVDFDPDVSTFTMSSTTSSATNGFVCKFNSSGSFIWARQLVGSQANKIAALAVDPAGNIALAAYTTGTLDLDPDPVVNAVGTPSTASLAYVRLDAGGNFLSGFSYDVMFSESLPKIKFDRTGNTYVSGGFFGTVDFDPGPATTTLTSSSIGNSNSFLCKFSTSGTFIWAVSFVGNQYVGLLDFDFDSSGNVFTSGSFRSSADFDPGPTNYSLISTSGSSDAFVVKLDASGNFQWAGKFGGAATDVAAAISTDTLSNIYIGGQFSGSGDFDPGLAAYTMTSNGATDGFICKLNSSGTLLWANHLGGANAEDIRDLKVDKDNKIFVLASCNTLIDFDLGPGTYTLATVGGSQDVFLLKLDEAGNFMQVKQFGGSGFDWGNTLALDANGSVYIAGMFAATGDFDPNGGVVNLTSQGGQDVYFCKLSACIDVPLKLSCEAKRLCTGASASFTALSVSPITWFTTATAGTSVSSGSLIITPSLSPGTYTYYAEASTCTLAGMRTGFILTVDALPSLSVSVNPTHVCAGEVATFSVSGASTYTWNTLQQTSVISATPSSASNHYTVTGTNTLTGCSATKTTNVIFSNCLGLQENESDFIFSSYPNPFSDFLKINLSEKGNVTIFDLYGRIVFTSLLEKGLITISSSEFKEGIYILKITLSEKESKIYNQKIVKVKAD